VRNKYAKINLYLTPELYEHTDAAVILEPHPVSVGDWIRRQMKLALEVKDAEMQIKKAKKKLRNLVEAHSFEELSDRYGIPVARMKAMLGEK
jgi:hypothetical protein